MLGADAEWKTYLPKAAFNAADAVGFKGEKIFEQPVISSQPGTHTVPALSFSFFDPGTRRYETAHTAPLSVVVSPPPADRMANELPAPASTAGSPGDESHTGLRPDHAATGARAHSLVPLYFQPRFLALPTVLAALFGGGWVALRRRERDAADLRRQRERERSQMTRALVERMAAAAARGDAAVFFGSARALLQQALSARWQIAPADITMAEVEARLEPGGDDGIRQIFALADEANYSGDDLQAADFERWTALVRRHSEIRQSEIHHSEFPS
jgi:hypothetical protein